ncbi:MAG TPA: hypothetical protein VFK47_06215, partial [Ktedonobacteraceae bacterium]|nr:hypothetical protein [Ktedonobacteraceae bacterium]
MADANDLQGGTPPQSGSPVLTQPSIPIQGGRPPGVRPPVRFGGGGGTTTSGTATPPPPGSYQALLNELQGMSG